MLARIDTTLIWHTFVQVILIPPKMNISFIAKRFSLSILMTCLFLGSSAQNTRIKLDESKKLGSAMKSPRYTAVCVGEVNTPSTDLKWRPILTKKVTAFEPKNPDEELIERIKAEKLLLTQNKSTSSAGSENATLSTTPIMGTNYLGNENNGTSPMDNQLAISDGGWIVSVANNTIEYDNTSGSTIYYNELLTFINDAAVTGVCDPYVLYDKGADRFIFFCQTSPITSSSNILIFFSKTNNPNDGWWYYKLTGNPKGISEGFDYPKLAISNNELYITGNLFYDPALTFDEAVIYQIQKSGGYSGGTINWQYWHGLTGAPFTLLPVSDGHGAAFGPGCYFVATSSSGASNIKLYDLTDDMTGSPSLNFYSVATTAYSPAADAYQSGTSCMLDNGDCRSLSGFYLNGTIHFVFHSDIGSGWNGINYNRLNLTALSNQSSTFGSAGSYHYSYPSVVSFTTSLTDKSVMIGFGRSSASIYPEVRVVNCDNGMNWSSSTLVKSSASYVSYTSTTMERWGDYTGTTRKHNSSTPSIWMNGMWATSVNEWSTWVAEIHNSFIGIEEQTDQNQLKVFPNPVIETFNVEFNLEQTSTIEINVVDVNGKKVKELFSGKGLQGLNSFSFNKANLAIGTYFLTINDDSKIIKNEKIIIAK